MLGVGALVAGLALAAYLLGIPVFWIAVAVIIFLAIAFIAATSRRSNPPSMRR
jgi:H+/gluconate symporter-like permease